MLQNSYRQRQDKSWVVGIQVGNVSKAYDWNDLKKLRIIHDIISNTPIVLVLAADDKSFAAFEIPGEKTFTLRNDSLISESVSYNFIGQDASNPSNKLKSIKAYQEFWHSWRTFHPNTRRFENN